MKKDTIYKRGWALWRQHPRSQGAKASKMAAAISRFSDYFTQGFHRVRQLLEAEILLSDLSLYECILAKRKNSLILEWTSPLTARADLPIGKQQMVLWYRMPQQILGTFFVILRWNCATLPVTWQIRETRQKARPTQFPTSLWVNFILFQFVF